MDAKIQDGPLWRAFDLKAESKPGALGVGEALRGIAGVGGRQASDIRGALSGGSGAAGGFTLPDDMFEHIVTLTSHAQTMVQAGARVVEVLHDDLTIPRMLSMPTPAWRLENAAVAESDPTFEQAKLTPRSLAVMVKVSRELLEDGFEIDKALTTILVGALAQEIDRGILRGTGTAPEPLGLLSRAAINDLTSTAASVLDTYLPLNNAIWQLRGDPFPSEPNAYIVGFPLAAILDGMTDVERRPQQMPKALADMPRFTAKALAYAAGDPFTDGYAAAIGDFTQMLIGWKNGIRVELLRERYADVGQVAFLVHVRVSMELLNRWSFRVLRGLKKTSWI